METWKHGVIETSFHIRKGIDKKQQKTITCMYAIKQPCIKENTESRNNVYTGCRVCSLAFSFTFGWSFFSVGFPFQLVFLFGWFSFLAGFPFQLVSFFGWFSFFIWFSFFSLSRRAKSSHLYAEPSGRGCRKALPTSSPGRHCQNKNFLECQGRRKRGLTSHKQTFRHSY